MGSSPISGDIMFSLFLKIWIVEIHCLLLAQACNVLSVQRRVAHRHVATVMLLVCWLSLMEALSSYFVFFRENGFSRVSETAAVRSVEC